jgi:hypothetical protein
MKAGSSSDAPPVLPEDEKKEATTRLFFNPRRVSEIQGDPVELWRELIERDRGSTEQAQLLEESARIAMVELPGLSTSARQLSAKWREQSLLDAKGAERTLAELESELARIETDAESLLDRQIEIAARLNSMREE